MSSLYFIPTPPTLVYADCEDIGDAKVSTASSWQLEELRHIATAGKLQRSSCFQCLLGESDRPRPTAFLTNFALSSPFVIGPSLWPSYTYHQGKACYNGPLKLPCGCGQTHRSLKRARGNDEDTSRSSLLTSSTIHIIFESAIHTALRSNYRYSDLLRKGDTDVVASDSEPTEAEDAPSPSARARNNNNTDRGRIACGQAFPPRPLFVPVFKMLFCSKQFCFYAVF